MTADQNCHCGNPVCGVRDGLDLGPAAAALCDDCLPLRCDAYPGACGFVGAYGREATKPSGEVRTTSSTGGQKGVKLARHSLIPAGPLHALAEHFGVGGLKYDSHQWRKGYEYSKSYDAIQRHALEWLAGRSYDTCSNANYKDCAHVTADGEPFKSPREDACYNHTASHHMSAIAWHAFGIQEFEDRFPEHDDRYKP